MGQFSTEKPALKGQFSVEINSPPFECRPQAVEKSAKISSVRR